MKKILTILAILISVNAIGQITTAKYQTTFTKTPSIDASVYKLNGVTKELSQWTTSGANIYYTAGYVGIGTTTPGSPLNVAANGRCASFWSNGTADKNGISFDNPNLGSSQVYSNFTGTNTEQSLIFGTYSNRANQLYLHTSGNVGIGVSPSYKIDVNGTSRFGTSTNFTSTESDGTLVFYGDATVYKDAIVNFIYSGGTGEAKLDTYIGSIKQLKFLTGDYVYFSNTEAPHDWDESTAIEIHLHWMVNSNLIAGDKIRWQLEYAVANIVANGNPNTIFCDPTNPLVFGSRTVTVEYTAPVGGTPAGTHLYTTFETVTPTDFYIGAGFIGALRRTAKTAGGTDPTVGSIFASNVGIHYKVNTIGSRTTSAK